MRDVQQTIPLIEPYMGKNAPLYIAECFESKWISSRGHFIRDFEKSFAEYIGCKHAVAVSNGTVALHIALIGLGIGDGDEVIVPDLTFAATINVVLHARAIPVIVDIDEKTWNISISEIEKAITSKTKAIIPVHLYGYPCNMDKICALAKKHKLKVIEDCAEAHGAEWKERKVGVFGDCAAFSFYGNKIITTGEGGMVVLDDDETYEKILVLRDHGMNKNNRYHYDVVGYNYRMTNPQAALGLAQLEEIGEILEHRDKIQSLYECELRKFDNIILRISGPDVKSVNWLFTCLVPNKERLEKELANEGIESRPMFYPLHTMKIYQKYCREKCKVSSSISKKGITLPTYYNMPEAYVERVCKVIEKWEKI